MPYSLGLGAADIESPEGPEVCLPFEKWLQVEFTGGGVPPPPPHTGKLMPLIDSQNCFAESQQDIGDSIEFSRLMS